MKVSIIYPFVSGPYGGANQFLKCLKRQFEDLGCYVEDARQADVLLFNLSPGCFDRLAHNVVRELHANPRRIVIARIDGPVSLIRGRDDGYDLEFFNFIGSFTAGAVFQSEWSLMRCKEMGYRTKNERVIMNAPDSQYFYPPQAYAERLPSTKCRVIATSWSTNPRKGFATYSWLEKNLDWERFELTFVGDTSVSFTRANLVGPCDSEKLGRHLRSHDIILTASRADPCSNALLEGMACGLPAVAYRDGGHPEIIGDGGELFSTHDELLRKLELVRRDLDKYRERLPDRDCRKVASDYLSFFRDCADISTQPIGPFSVTQLRARALMRKLRGRFSTIFGKRKLV